MTSSSGNHENPDLRLHKLVFENKISQLSQLLNHDKEDEHFEQLKDQHGNTPLHLAVMLGHKECVQLLLKHGHGILIKNQYNWTPLQEAVSYGDRQTITSMYRFHRRQNKKAIKKQKPEIREALKALGGDFYMEMRWDFQSWIPFVSRILPADTCHIYRSGNRIRMDSTLEDFSEMRWVHGDITLIVDFSMDEPDVLLLDNKNKVYQHMKESTPQEHEASIEDEVDISMSTDIVDAAMKTKESSIEPVNTGWFFTHQKSEKIGQFTADFYRISNLLLVTRKRREHLSEEDLKKNKMLSEAISKGEDAGKILDECDRDPERRQSLPPPEPCTVTWDDYSNTTSDPCLGRSRKEKLNTKKFEASLGMSTEFPVKLENLLPIFAALGTKAKLFLKLKEFVTLRLPSGFPVRITIPVFPTVKAVVNFPQFEFRTSIPSSMFSVPSDYREEPSWFEKSCKERKEESASKKKAKSKT